MAVSLTVSAELAGFGVGWTDISTDRTDAVVGIVRRFQSNVPDDLVAAPAVLRFGLNNSVHNSGGKVGYYSPGHANVRSGWAEGIRVRVQSTANGTTRTRFIGWIQTIAPVAGTYNDQTVAVSATSWLQLAATTLVSGVAAQVSQRGDQLVATLAALAQFAPPATSYATGMDTYPYALDDLDPSQSTIVDGFDSIAKSGLDRIYEKADGTLVFESRRLREAGATSALVITDAAPGGEPGLAWSGLAPQRAIPSIYNRVQVTVHPKKVDASAVVLYAYQISASSVSIAPSNSVVINGPYLDPNQQAQQIGGFNMIDDGFGFLPAGDWQITSRAGGTGSDLSAFFTVAVSFDANQVTFTLTNNGTVDGYIAKLQARGQGIYDYQIVIGSASNSSSLALIGQSAIKVDCPYQSSALFAEAAAQYIAALWGQSISQLEGGGQLFLNADDEVSVDTLLALELSSAVGVTETVSGLSAGAYWVNGFEESYDERNNLSLTLDLVPRFTGQAWTLGVVGYSELGSTTRLIYV